MLCAILRVWERWAAVVDSKLICVSTQKDRAITLWKAGDAQMSRMSIEKFVFLTFLDHRFEMIEAEELVGRGKTYRTAMRSGAKVSENDKDEIAKAMELVRSADWAQLPPKLQGVLRRERCVVEGACRLHEDGLGDYECEDRCGSRRLIRRKGSARRQRSEGERGQGESVEAR